MATTLVTGATRGVGLGIAVELGRAGHTVLLTGRTATGTHPDGTPGNLESAARAVQEAGGEAVPLPCDHLDDAQNRALADRVRDDFAPLDALVNNAWAGYERHEAGFLPFWQQDLDPWDRMFGSLRAQYALTGLLWPHLAPGATVVHVGSDLGGDVFLGSVVYDTVKTALRRMTYGMGVEAAGDEAGNGVTVLGVMPGFTRTERVLAADLPASELERTHSPGYVGKAVAAVLADPERHRWNGRMLDVGDAATEYDFVDEDGRRVPPFRALPEEVRYPAPSAFR